MATTSWSRELALDIPSDHDEDDVVNQAAPTGGAPLLELADTNHAVYVSLKYESIIRKTSMTDKLDTYKYLQRIYEHKSKSFMEESGFDDLPTDENGVAFDAGSKYANRPLEKSVEILAIPDETLPDVCDFIDVVNTSFNTAKNAYEEVHDRHPLTKSYKLQIITTVYTGKSFNEKNKNIDGKTLINGIQSKDVARFISRSIKRPWQLRCHNGYSIMSKTADAPAPSKKRSRSSFANAIIITFKEPRGVNSKSVSLFFNGSFTICGVLTTMEALCLAKLATDTMSRAYNACHGLSHENAVHFEPTDLNLVQIHSKVVIPAGIQIDQQKLHNYMICENGRASFYDKSKYAGVKIIYTASPESMDKLGNISVFSTSIMLNAFTDLVTLVQAYEFIVTTITSVPGIIIKSAER